jgi:hypothetical protein
MTEPRRNIFRFRRLKWGAPRRLDGLKAIGLAEGRAAGGAAPEARGPGRLGLWVAALAAGLAIGMGLLGWF